MKPVHVKVVLVAVAALVATSAPAHHSAAMFDFKQCLIVKGVVRTFEWQNPHSWLWVFVTDKDAKTDIWGFEFPSPSQLVALDAHWSPNSLRKGDKVTVSYAPLKDGRHGGLLNAVTGADGHVLHGAPNAVHCEEQNWSRK